MAINDQEYTKFEGLISTLNSPFQQLEHKRLLLISDIYELSSKIIQDVTDDQLKNDRVRKLKNENKKTKEFLMTIFNVPPSPNEDATIKKRIAEFKESANSKISGESHRIPGRVPHTVALLTSQTLFQRKNKRKKLLGLVVAKKRGKIATVNAESRVLDSQLNTKTFSPYRRDAASVHINNKGLFVSINSNNSFITASTSQSRSHNKEHFASFVMNLNGDITLFVHNRMADRVAHSSVNSRQAVLCAGEMKIVDGKLEVITTHSGHYRPNIYNIYELLKQLKSRNVDITSVVIVFISSMAHERFPQALRSLKIVSNNMRSPECDKEYRHRPYTVNAGELYDKMKALEESKRSCKFLIKMIMYQKNQIKELQKNPTDNTERISEADRIINRCMEKLTKLANPDIPEASIFIIMHLMKNHLQMAQWCYNNLMNAPRNDILQIAEEMFNGFSQITDHENVDFHDQCVTEVASLVDSHLEFIWEEYSRDVAASKALFVDACFKAVSKNPANEQAILDYYNQEWTLNLTRLNASQEEKTTPVEELEFKLRMLVVDRKINSILNKIPIDNKSLNEIIKNISFYEIKKFINRMQVITNKLKNSDHLGSETSRIELLDKLIVVSWDKYLEEIASSIITNTELDMINGKIFGDENKDHINSLIKELSSEHRIKLCQRLEAIIPADTEYDKRKLADIKSYINPTQVKASSVPSTTWQPAHPRVHVGAPSKPPRPPR